MHSITKFKWLLFSMFIISCLRTLNLYQIYSNITTYENYVNTQELNESKQINILHSKCSCRKVKLHLKPLNGSYFSVSENQYENYWKSFFYETDPGLVVSVDELYKTSCDLYNSLRRGKNQKIIGLSLYGNYVRYYYHLESRLDLNQFI